MSDRTNVQVLELCLKALPYPEHIADIDLSDADALRITWRRASWRVAVKGLDVMRRENGCLIGDDASILMRTLLQRHAAADAQEAYRLAALAKDAQQ